MRPSVPAAAEGSGRIAAPEARGRRGNRAARTGPGTRSRRVPAEPPPAGTRVTPSAPLSQSSPSAVSTMPDTPRSGSPAVSQRDEERAAGSRELACVERGHAGLAPDPHAVAVHGDGEHASQVESLLRAEHADRVASPPAPAAPRVAQPRAAAAVRGDHVGEAPLEPCCGPNGSQPRPRPPAEHAVIERDRHPQPVRPARAPSPGSRARWPILRAALAAAARERTRHLSAPRVRDRRSRGRRGDRGRCTSASAARRAAGRCGHRPLSRAAGDPRLAATHTVPLGVRRDGRRIPGTPAMRSG